MAHRGDERSWTLLTSHGHVLVEIARDPEALIKDISVAIGITERTTATIVADLVAAGFVTRKRVGRRNHYEVHLDHGFRHPAQRDLRVGPFLDLLTEGRLSQSGSLYLVEEALVPPADGGEGEAGEGEGDGGDWHGEDAVAS